jgi:hypothetical protein
MKVCSGSILLKKASAGKITKYYFPSLDCTAIKD